MHTEFTDQQRTRALEVMLHKAELDAGIKDGKEYPINQRGYRILERARHTGIQTRYYQLAWFLWKETPATQ